jgi:apolipoprotein D and lipocalin family protein
MQFIWPIKAEYRVLFVSEAYDQAVIGRSKRDYLWIMARTPSIAPGEYQALVDMVEEQGYDVAKIRKVPQLPDL